MKTIFILVFLELNVLHAKNLEPVNFRKNNRLGQVSTVSKIISGKNTEVMNLKFCFVDGGIISADYPIPTGCSAKIVIDTKEELKYESNCQDTGLSTYYSKKISENVVESTVISKDLRFEQTSTYDGPVCDKDAVRK